MELAGQRHVTLIPAPDLEASLAVPTVLLQLHCQIMVDAHGDAHPEKGPVQKPGPVHAHGSKVPYPKHVWSPSGGWYAQPANWKANTAIFGVLILGIAGVAFNLSTKLEKRHHMPEKGRFYPSRYWTKQIIEHEEAEAAKVSAARSI